MRIPSQAKVWPWPKMTKIWSVACNCMWLSGSLCALALVFSSYCLRSAYRALNVSAGSQPSMIYWCSVLGWSLFFSLFNSVCKKSSLGSMSESGFRTFFVTANSPSWIMKNFGHTSCSDEIKAPLCTFNSTVVANSFQSIALDHLPKKAVDLNHLSRTSLCLSLTCCRKCWKDLSVRVAKMQVSSVITVCWRVRLSVRSYWSPKLSPT